MTPRQLERLTRDARHWNAARTRTIEEKQAYMESLWNALEIFQLDPKPIQSALTVESVLFPNVNQG